MAQTPFNPTPGVSTHEDCVNTINANVTDAESRLGALESAPPAHTHTVSQITDIAATYAPISHTHTVSDITDIAATYAPISHTHTVSQITDIAATYAPISHTHTVSDLDSALAADGSVATADGAGNVVWELPNEADVFSVVTVTNAAYAQTTQHTNHLYDDTLLTPGGGGSGGSGGGACMIVDLLPVAQHVGVTIHKKIGDSCDIELVAPVGSTIDGAASYLLTSQYESISIFTDGSNYFIQ